MGRSQERLDERGNAVASNRKVRIRKASGTNTSHAIAIVEGNYPKGAWVSLTVATNTLAATEFRYPAATGVTQTTSAAKMATELAALIDAHAKLAATARDGVISIVAAGGDTTVALTLPAFTLNDVVAPGVAGVPAVSNIGQTTATVTWTAAYDATGVVDYLVDRAPNSGGAPGAWTNVATVTAPTVTSNLTGLSAATSYWVGVRARDAAGNISARRVSAALFTTTA